MRGHFAHQVDGNQRLIVTRLRKLPGVSVTHTHVVGLGFPDICVARDGSNFLLEIKRPGEELNEQEKTWHRRWHGQVAVVHSSGEAYLAIGLPLNLVAELIAKDEEDDRRLEHQRRQQLKGTQAYAP